MNAIKKLFPIIAIGLIGAIALFFAVPNLRQHVFPITGVIQVGQRNDFDIEIEGDFVLVERATGTATYKFRMHPSRRVMRLSGIPNGTYTVLDGTAACRITKPEHFVDPPNTIACVLAVSQMYLKKEKGSETASEPIIVKNGEMTNVYLTVNIGPPLVRKTTKEIIHSVEFGPTNPFNGATIY